MFKRGYVNMGSKSALWTYGGTGANGERDGAVVEALKQTPTHELKGLFGKGPRGRNAFVVLTACEAASLYEATNFFFG